MTVSRILISGLLLAATWLAVHAGDNDYVDNVGINFGKGKTFFLSNVLPRMAENGCLTCHARGYVRPNVTQYEELIRRLAIGDSAVNNAVIYKIANVRSFLPEIPNHPGGQRCGTIDDEPCKSIRQWWEIEFGQEGADN
jgi:hypothetical protein